MRETASSGTGILVDVAAESNALKGFARSKWGAAKSAMMARWLTRTSIALAAIDLLKATKDAQKEYQECMEW